MNHIEKSVAYHHKGFNCCQSVLAAFSDVTGLSEQASFDAAGGFGAGMQTGEACGAIVGAIMTLGLLHPVDPEQPVPSKQRTGRLAKEFQRRFKEKFGELRCHPLLKTEIAGQKVFATHGHAYKVKYDRDYQTLRYAALEADARLVLFGHTHVPYHDRVWGMEMINPGSIGYGNKPSYAVVELDETGVTADLKRI